MSLSIERVRTGNLVPRVHEQVRALCDAAYGENLAGYFADIGPGVHLLGWHGPALVSHLMWVDRTLYVEGREPLRSAYVELVATRKSDQGRRFATRLMERLALEIQGYDIGALSPAETTLYQRLGWERWHGALSVRTAAGDEIRVAGGVRPGSLHDAAADGGDVVRRQGTARSRAPDAA